MSESQLQQLIDRAGIDDAINSYSHAFDQREWALLSEAFTPDARIVLLDRDTVYSPASLVAALSGNDATRLSGQHLDGKDSCSDLHRPRRGGHRGTLDQSADHRAEW